MRSAVRSPLPIQALGGTRWHINRPGICIYAALLGVVAQRNRGITRHHFTKACLPIFSGLRRHFHRMMVHRRGVAPVWTYISHLNMISRIVKIHRPIIFFVHKILLHMHGGAIIPGPFPPPAHRWIHRFHLLRQLHPTAISPVTRSTQLNSTRSPKVLLAPVFGKPLLPRVILVECLGISLNLRRMLKFCIMQLLAR